MEVVNQKHPFGIWTSYVWDNYSKNQCAAYVSAPAIVGTLSPNFQMISILKPKIQVSSLETKFQFNFCIMQFNPLLKFVSFLFVSDVGLLLTSSFYRFIF